MPPLTEIELVDWAALYAATALCRAIALGLSAIVVAARLARERPRQDLRTVDAAMLLVPKTWWRWQTLYLTSTPVTLAIVLSFAISLRWS